jgi:hydroxymethylpyrimidine pyrophosphatase-like HAD family hydrolase
MTKPEFPRPIDKVALVDLDGTLIDQDYRVADDRIYGAITDAQSAGWQIGLSSDTPYEALTLWKERFGMNGPVIAEKGAVVEAGGQLAYDNESAAAFSASRLAIEQALRCQPGFRLWSGDPVEALRENIVIGEPGEVAVLMNGLRSCSLSFSIRRVTTDSRLALDDQETKAVAEVARQFYPDFSDLEEEINPDYGIVIVSRSQNAKRAGTLRVMAVMGLRRVAMIGNSMGDYLGNDNLAVHYAVGDATPEFKRIANYTAKDCTTSGVIEILEKLRGY